MHQSQLIANWALQKTTCNYHALESPQEVEFEFKGRYGHPSSYAYVKFRAKPATELTFTVAVEWPEEFDAEYAERIQNTVGEAVVDGLLSVQNGYPHRACHVSLIGFRWDNVGGSEAAVAKATTKAMELLRKQGKWAFSGGHYREYVPSAA